HLGAVLDVPSPKRLERLPRLAERRPTDAEPQRELGDLRIEKRVTRLSLEPPETRIEEISHRKLRPRHERALLERARELATKRDDDALLAIEKALPRERRARSRR